MSFEKLQAASRDFIKYAQQIGLSDFGVKELLSPETLDDKVLKANLENLKNIVELVHDDIVPMSGNALHRLVAVQHALEEALQPTPEKGSALDALHGLQSNKPDAPASNTPPITPPKI